MIDRRRNGVYNKDMRKDNRTRLEADVEIHHKKHIQKKAKKLRTTVSFVVRQIISNDMEQKV